MNDSTLTPPTKPGTYRCRFPPADGMDREPFEVELLEDTINGGVVAKGKHGICVRVELAHPNCEWEDLGEEL